MWDLGQPIGADADADAELAAPCYEGTLHLETLGTLPCRERLEAYATHYNMGLFITIEGWWVAESGLIQGRDQGSCELVSSVL
jgi:hypothetical protein